MRATAAAAPPLLLSRLLSNKPYILSMGFYTINGGIFCIYTRSGGTQHGVRGYFATEIRGALGITRDVGFTAYSYKVQILILY